MSFAAAAGSFASVVSAPVQASAASSSAGSMVARAFAVRDNVVVLPLVGIVRLGGLLLIALLITAGCGPPN